VYEIFLSTIPLDTNKEIECDLNTCAHGEEPWIDETNQTNDV